MPRYFAALLIALLPALAQAEPPCKYLSVEAVNKALPTYGPWKTAETSAVGCVFHSTQKPKPGHNPTLLSFTLHRMTGSLGDQAPAGFSPDEVQRGVSWHAYQDMFSLMGLFANSSEMPLPRAKWPVLADLTRQMLRNLRAQKVTTIPACEYFDEGLLKATLGGTPEQLNQNRHGNCYAALANTNVSFYCYGDTTESEIAQAVANSKSGWCKTEILSQNPPARLNRQCPGDKEPPSVVLAFQTGNHFCGAILHAAKPIGEDQIKAFTRLSFDAGRRLTESKK